MTIFNKYPLWIWFSVLVPIFIMLPVLIWPHYGLFSDADQLIEYPKMFFNHPGPELGRLLRPFDDGRYQPLFYFVTLGVYAVKPNSAWIFYVFQWIILLITSSIAAWLVYRLTKSSLSAVLSVLLFCFSSSIYENFYTLDKVEPRVTFFSALFLWVFVRYFLDHHNQHIQTIKKSPDYFFWGIQFLLGVSLVFSKETGIYLAFSIFLVWVALIFNNRVEARSKTIFLYSLLLQITVVILFYTLYHLLWEQPDTGRYLKYEITSQLIKTNFIYYLSSSPEAIFGILTAFLLLIRYTLNYRRQAVSTSDQITLLIAVCLLVYFMGILIWRWPLDYFLMPVHFFSAILIAIFFNSVFGTTQVNKKSIQKVALLIFLILFIYFSGQRMVVGILIYQQDALKDDLATVLAEPRWDQQHIILPFESPNSAEIGDRINYFTNQLIKNSSPLRMYYFWEPNEKILFNITRFENSYGIAPKRSQLMEIVKHSHQDAGAIPIWKFTTKASKDPSLPWEYDYLKPGDYLLLPFGINIPQWSHARGLSMYSDSHFIKRGLPERLQFKDEQDITRSIGPWKIGWRIVKAEKI